MPTLAVALLVMNGRRKLVGEEFRSGWGTTGVLVLTVALFAYLAIAGIRE
jgi:hypothetical protein